MMLPEGADRAKKANRKTPRTTVLTWRTAEGAKWDLMQRCRKAEADGKPAKSRCETGSEETAEGQGGLSRCAICPTMPRNAILTRRRSLQVAPPPPGQLRAFRFKSTKPPACIGSAAEHDGVLLIGPSPVAPRSAQRTSASPCDRGHPLDYLQFEGTIHEGQLRRGTVMLWDLGWWQPLHDVDDGLAPAICISRCSAAGDREMVADRMKGNKPGDKGARTGFV